MAKHTEIERTLSRPISRRRLLLEGAWVTAAAALVGTGLRRHLISNERNEDGVRVRDASQALVAPVSIAYVRDSAAARGNHADGTIDATGPFVSGFTPVTESGAGDRQLRNGARVAVHRFAPGAAEAQGGLRSIAFDAVSPAGFVHHVWRFDNTPVPSIGSPTAFFAPMGAAGLRLQFQIERAGAAPTTVPVSFSASDTPGALPARPGVYALAFPPPTGAAPRWRRCAFVCDTDGSVGQGRVTHRGREIDTPYLVISMEASPKSPPSVL